MSAAVIPILRFRAGAVPCAVAAREVRAVRPASTEHPALWRLLRVAPANREDPSRADAWVLGLSHRSVPAEILVQGPVEIIDVTADDLLPPPAALVLSNRRLIFGFVRFARELVVLLDIPSLVELAS